MDGLNSLRKMIGPVLVSGLVATVVTVWQSSSLEPQARAEPRRITPQEPDQHFKSGGRLSEAVLQEILVVLKRIDERLERMEKAVDQFPADAQGSNSGGVAEQRSAPGAAPIQVRRNR